MKIKHLLLLGIALGSLFEVIDSARGYSVTNFTGNFVLASSPAVGTLPNSVVAADVNGDGKVDLISANTGAVKTPGSTLTVLVNNGSGGFTVSSSPTVGSGPRIVAAADVNGDGKVDLISANSFGSSLTVLVNNGSGGFTTSATLALGTKVYSVTAADVNGDGKKDLICTGGANLVGVLTNNGSGGFPSVTFYTVGNTPKYVVAADVNGDGKMDLISANSGDGTLSVLTNNGGGGFMLASTPSAGATPNAVEAADVNGDGKMDLIAVNDVMSGTLTVLTNDGNSGFVTAGTYAVGNYPNSVCAADVNSDGKVDIICANGNNSTLSVLTNNGSGGFVLASSPAVGSVPDFVIAVDVNGDGGPDLISANLSGNSLTVLVNTFVVTYPPLITGFSPTNALPGTSVILNGANLGSITSVLFNGQSAAFSINSATQITATVPATAGTGHITVLGANGTATSTNLFYVPPVITGFTPTNGGYYAFVTITGINLNGATSVTFGGAGASFTNISGIQLTAAVPTNAVTGHITVVTTNGIATSTNLFYYIYQPVITSFTPNTGPYNTPVTITGSNFLNAMYVTFNNVPAAFAVNSDAQITATVPDCAGIGPITVTTPAGTAVSSNNFVFQRQGVTVGVPLESVLDSALCNGSTVTLAFDGTIAVTSGKAISSDVVLDGTGHNVTISGNNNFGVFNVNPGAHLTLRNLTIANGNSISGGGAIYNNGGLVTVVNCTFSNNIAVGAGNGGYAYGGAICNNGGVLTVSGSTFVNNSIAGGTGGTGSQGIGQYAPGAQGGPGGYGLGGALCNLNGGTVAITNCTFCGNQAIGGSGGTGGRGYDGYQYQYICGYHCCGTFCSSQCPDYCTGTVFGGPGGQSGNGGTGYGGSIYNNQGNLTIVNTTFANGSASGGGAGLPGQAGNYGSGNLGSGLSGGGVGGNLGQGIGQFVLKNCILANPAAGGNYWGGTITDAGNNLSSDATIAFAAISSFTNANPNLDSLANNGGTTMTMALLPASPAVRAGDADGAPATDQRGQPRKALQIDIGAYETPVIPSDIPSILTGTKTAGGSPFKLTFTNTPGTSYSIWTSTNLLLPPGNWTCLGFVREIAPGQFQFSDSNSAGSPWEFYRVQSP